jgi:predicted phosphodiesterase
MRIALISDIHSNLEALEAVIKSLPQHDEIICLGDVVGYGPNPNEVIENLQRLNPTITLMGNHDNAVVTGNVQGFTPNAAKAIEWTMREISRAGSKFLTGLKPSARLDRAGIRLAFFHASPRDPLSEYIFPGISETAGRGFLQMANAQVLLLGHTHMPMFYRFDGQVLANPGSVGQPRDGDPRASFALLTVSRDEVNFEVRRVQYNVRPVSERILRSGLPAFLAERLYIGV